MKIFLGCFQNVFIFDFRQFDYDICRQTALCICLVPVLLSILNCKFMLFPKLAEVLVIISSNFSLLLLGF